MNSLALNYHVRRYYGSYSFAPGWFCHLVFAIEMNYGGDCDKEWSGM